MGIRVVKGEELDWKRKGVPAVMGLAYVCERRRLIYCDGPLPVFSSLLIPLTRGLIIMPNTQNRRGLAG